MNTEIKYFIGVDGGGTGTRVLVTDKTGKTIATSQGAPSALALGIENSWSAISHTIQQAFASAHIQDVSFKQCALGLGLSGVNHNQWKNQFLLKNPCFDFVEIETDAYTSLLGAHGGEPGSIIALGTGSVGLALHRDGSTRSVSGWGFPSGDEASGSWLGLQAIRLAQKTLDQRASPSLLSEKILHHCGTTPEALLGWLATATPSTYAALAPYVFECAAQGDWPAQMLLKEASLEVYNMAQALDPRLELPLAICGKLGQALTPYLPQTLHKVLTSPQGDAVQGALHLAQKKFL